MNGVKKTNAHLGGFSSGTDLGGKVLRYRNKQNIYKQGAPAYTLFYIQEGGVRLSTKTKEQPSAITAILGVGDFFGELSLTARLRASGFGVRNFTERSDQSRRIRFACLIQEG